MGLMVVVFSWHHWEFNWGHFWVKFPKGVKYFQFFHFGGPGVLGLDLNLLGKKGKGKTLTPFQEGLFGGLKPLFYWVVGPNLLQRGVNLGRAIFLF